jgi:fructosamine-3-kinase
VNPRSRAAIEQATGRELHRAEALSGGCVGTVYRVAFADGGGDLVAKLGEIGSGLAVEGAMLRYLAAHGPLPVPSVVHESEALLLLEYVPGEGGITESAEEDAARLLSRLHGVSAPAFGFAWDTRIGGLVQPNPETLAWRDFFRDHRLLYMGREAHRAGRLPRSLLLRIERLAGRLDRWLDEPGPPALVHGDLWSGNLLCREGRIVAFLDPAIYYADAEIELAFIALFSTFGERFFARYRELRPIRPGFFEERRDLYNLYPLLVHARLFGGAYVDAVARTLSRYGV